MAEKNKIENLRSLSQIFSNSNFQKIVRKRDYYQTIYRINKHTNLDPNLKNQEALEIIYRALIKLYKNEYVYKNILINKLLLKKYSLATTVSFNEFKIGDSISDFVMLNGEARVYEIKTELDKLDKIEKQIEDYQKFGNKIYVVAHQSHIPKLLDLYSQSEIGIIELTKRNALKEIKGASESKLLEIETLFKTLRKDEYLEIILKYYGSIPNVPNTLIFRECMALSKRIPILEFQKLVIEVLKKRTISNPEILLSEEVPQSLKHICYNLDLSKREYHQLSTFLNLKINQCIFHT
ncbi:MAG: sce7726 family protein [Bacteroidota bacterium]|nr:sce7726 family protein [Bacteroidota bacterium]